MTASVALPSERGTSTRQLASLLVAGQQFAIAIDPVRDILGAQQPTIIPSAPPEIAAVLILRSRVVTVIDLRRRLDLPADGNAKRRQALNIVVDHRGELYSLLVDRIGDVLTVEGEPFEAEMTSLPQQWRQLARGIVRLDQALVVELDIERLLALEPVA